MSQLPISHLSSANLEIAPDKVLVDIARYVATSVQFNQNALKTARHALIDSLGCALLALNYPECVKNLGPLVPGITVESGIPIPGTSFVLDPVQAAFNIGTMIRWLDYNDTWLAAEWGHPSDNLGAIIAAAAYKDRTIGDLLNAMIKAYEIQGVLALTNSFNRVGLDHVLLVRVASTAVATQLLGGSEEQIRNSVSQAFIDGGALRTYRHYPNTGSRKSWAAGDATSRAVRLALLTLNGEMGYPTALTAKTWGFYDVLFVGKPFEIARPYGSYVMENILFKIAFPAEFHAQTAVEAAFKLHSEVVNRLDQIERIEIRTHESAIRIIDKKGPLHNPADRDHCLQYMTAIGLIYGKLTADHYEDTIASDPRIDTLRAKMIVTEDKQYSIDYFDPDKRSIANAVQVFFNDGRATEKIVVEYPLGHKRRRTEAMPLLLKKFDHNAKTRFDSERVEQITGILTQDLEELMSVPIQALLEKLNVSSKLSSPSDGSTGSGSQSKSPKPL